jgi:hypothetical protein
MKKGRLRALLEELESMRKIRVSKWLSHIAVHYGIRRPTGLEYLREWEDGDYIIIEEGIITFVRNIED